MANETLALDLDLFDNDKNGYIPEDIQKKRTKKFELLGDKASTPQRVAHDAKTTRAAAIKACAFMLATLFVVGSLIYVRVVLTKLESKLSEEQANLSISQSEYTSLQMKYNTLLSPDKVEDYAKNELGMVKRENYQIRYFDLSGEDGAQLTQ